MSTLFIEVAFFLTVSALFIETLEETHTVKIWAGGKTVDRVCARDQPEGYIYENRLLKGSSTISQVPQLYSVKYLHAPLS